jgi:esterase/lipase superfamily enzyme
MTIRLSTWWSSDRASVFVLVLALVLAGCATTSHPLMPTPALYTGPQARPVFTDLPADRRTPALDLLYVTDRKPAENADSHSPYTANRDLSLAFGSATVEFGENVSWDALVRASSGAERPIALQLQLGPTKELGRFPPIPYPVVRGPAGISRLPAVVSAHEKARQDLQAEISRRLALSPRKEVVLYVHGYHNSFADAVVTMGELCHFLGREFVCAVFSWPAGGTRGLNFGYNVDIESGEYAVEDLVKTIRIVATTPGVEKLHVLAHSRGNAILGAAMAELSAEAYMLGASLPTYLKLSNVVLMAPDVDADVALSKIFKVFSDPDLPFRGAPDPYAMFRSLSEFKVTIYASPDDKALAASGWLFGSMARLGRLDAALLTPEQIAELRNWGEADVIQVRGITDFFGHSYFVSNPEVSADIIAMVRYHLKPNDPGRPLVEVTRPFWRIPPAEGAAGGK